MSFGDCGEVSLCYRRCAANSVACFRFVFSSFLLSSGQATGVWILKLSFHSPLLYSIFFSQPVTTFRFRALQAHNSVCHNLSHHALLVSHRGIDSGSFFTYFGHHFTFSHVDLVLNALSNYRIT